MLLKFICILLNNICCQQCLNLSEWNYAFHSSGLEKFFREIAEKKYKISIRKSLPPSRSCFIAMNEFHEMNETAEEYIVIKITHSTHIIFCVSHFLWGFHFTEYHKKCQIKLNWKQPVHHPAWMEFHSNLFSPFFTIYIIFW